MPIRKPGATYGSWWNMDTGSFLTTRRRGGFIRSTHARLRSDSINAFILLPFPPLPFVLVAGQINFTHLLLSSARLGLRGKSTSHRISLSRRSATGLVGMRATVDEPPETPSKEF
ncbi:hypothetical protein EW146_g5596 [Bondarzewia mesenterica]|uniref:Uncharacterized protein n=1 Tax=Bondarzewia mesenterica TaxID=1095465 RepID=A0A4S4LT42_9AGAM|nr:hypothetical protein EW146_g5596 [Bondarzewia mesenterica]